MLRAIAALMVVAHHAPQYLSNRVSFDFGTYAHGAAGVDIFFIISGFVMHQATYARHVSAADFIKARLIRIVPMYWLCTSVLAGLAIFIPGLFNTFSISPASALKSLFFLPVYNHLGVFRPVLAQGWTLQYEMLFYLTTGAALLWWKRHASFFSALAILIGVLGVNLAGIDFHFSPWQILAPVSSEFIGGVLLGYAFTHKTMHSWRQHALAPYAGLAAIGLGYAIILQMDPSPLEPSRPVWGGGAWLIVFGFLLMEKPIARLHAAVKQLHVLGDSSYALYLIHGLSFSAISKIVPLQSLGHGAAALAVLIIGALIFGILLHEWAELPINRQIKALMPSRPRHATS
ncbi:MAG: acyltransferase [Aquabacterium sp.]